jgi:beta-xylosidase
MSVWPELCHCWAAWMLRLRAGTAVAVDGPPVDPRDFADPHVLRVGAVYFAYATNAGPTNVQVMTSPDLVHWKAAGDALPQLPPWAGPGRTWAPVVLPRDRGFVLFYTVREQRSGRQCISVASARRPEGPFVDTGAPPLVFQLDRGGSIDPSPFVDVDGTAYLLWKSDDNAFDRPSSLWGQRLAADGLTLEGESSELLRQDRGWERPLIEAPSMVRVDGRYYLFYSANRWESPNYAIGYAIGRSPLGPFTKITRRGPWFASSGGSAGPGGQEFFTDAGGGLRMAYHAWTPGTVGYDAGGARSVRIARVGFSHGVPTTRA